MTKPVVQPMTTSGVEERESAICWMPGVNMEEARGERMLIVAMMATLAILVRRGQLRGFSGSESVHERSSRVSFASPSSRWSKGSLSPPVLLLLLRIGRSWFAMLARCVLLLSRASECDVPSMRGPRGEVAAAHCKGVGLMLRNAQMFMCSTRQDESELMMNGLPLLMARCPAVAFFAKRPSMTIELSERGRHR